MRYFFLLVVIGLIFGAMAISQTSSMGSSSGSAKAFTGESVAGVTAATIPNKISYQGVLTTSSGTPAPDGSYNLKFELFNVSGGGSGLWTETQVGVNIQRGTFSVLLGSVTPLASLFYQPLWVEVTAVSGPGIGAPIVFSPRTELASAAYSLGPWISKADTLFAVNKNVGINTGSPKTALDVLSNSSPTIARFSLGGTLPITLISNLPQIGFNIGYFGGFRYDNSFYGGTIDFGQNIPGGFTINTAPSGTAGDIAPLAHRLAITNDGKVGIDTLSPQATLDVNGGVKVKDTLSIGSPTQNGFFNLYQNGATSPVVRAYNWMGQGGAIDYYDELGVWIGGFEADFNGTGGWFGVTRDTYLNGFVVDGNYNGTKEPWVGITGSARSAIFDMSKTGDASVQLPDSSISAAEILDEPGISQGIVKSTTITVTGATSMIDIDTTTITIPAAGYIVVEASAQAGFSGTTAGNTMSCQIDETSGGSLDMSYYYYVGFGGAAPSGATWIPVAMRRTYYKSAGTYTFRFEAMDAIGAGSKWFWNPAITATYYPTSYGPVSTAVSAEQVSAFQNATPITNNGAELQGVQSTGQAYQVDLRELELKAANARAAAEKAERELLQAKMGQQNGSLSPNQK